MCNVCICKVEKRAAAFTLCFNGSQANTGFAKPCIMFLLRQLWKLERGLMMVLALFYCGLSVCSCSSFVNFVALSHMSIIRKQSLTLNYKVQSSSGSKKHAIYRCSWIINRDFHGFGICHVSWPIWDFVAQKFSMNRTQFWWLPTKVKWSAGGIVGCCHSGLSTWLCFRIENRKYKERIFNVVQFIHQTLWKYVAVAQGRTFYSWKCTKTISQ